MVLAEVLSGQPGAGVAAALHDSDLKSSHCRGFPLGSIVRVALDSNAPGATAQAIPFVVLSYAAADGTQTAAPFSVGNAKGNINPRVFTPLLRALNPKIQPIQPTGLFLRLNTQEIKENIQKHLNPPLELGRFKTGEVFTATLGPISRPINQPALADTKEKSRLHYVVVGVDQSNMFKPRLVCPLHAPEDASRGAVMVSLLSSDLTGAHVRLRAEPGRVQQMDLDKGAWRHVGNLAPEELKKITTHFLATILPPLLYEAAHT